MPPRIAPPMMPTAAAPPRPLRIWIVGRTAPSRVANSVPPATGLKGSAETDPVMNSATSKPTALWFDADTIAGAKRRYRTASRER